MRESIALLQGEQSRVAAALEQKLLELDAARAALAATPATVTERKAMTDDALWQATTAGEARPDWTSLAGRTLVSEVANPVHQELSRTVSHLEIETNALRPRALQLAELIEKAVAAAREQEVELAGDVAGAAALAEERRAGLTALLAEQGAEASVLERSRARELAQLSGLLDNELAALQRELTTHSQMLSTISAPHTQALLAKAQAGSADVRLAARAVPGDEPESRGIAFKSATAAVLGALIGILVALATAARPRSARA